MDVYSIVGIVLFFSTLIIYAIVLYRSHGIKVDLEDKELKRAAMLVRLRNIALALGLVAVSWFFMLLGSMTALTPGTAQYEDRDNLTTIMLYAGLVLIAIAICLWVVGFKSELNFKHALQKYAVKVKVRAAFKFKPKLKFKPKSKRSTRV